MITEFIKVMDFKLVKPDWFSDHVRINFCSVKHSNFFRLFFLGSSSSDMALFLYHVSSMTVVWCLCCIDIYFLS